MYGEKSSRGYEIWMMKKRENNSVKSDKVVFVEINNEN